MFSSASLATSLGMFHLAEFWGWRCLRPFLGLSIGVEGQLRRGFPLAFGNEFKLNKFVGLAANPTPDPSIDYNANKQSQPTEIGEPFSPTAGSYGVSAQIDSGVVWVSFHSGGFPSSFQTVPGLLEMPPRFVSFLR